MFTYPVGNVGRSSPVFNGVIFAGGTNGAVAKSLNGGATWTDTPVSIGFDGLISGLYMSGTRVVAYGIHGFIQSTLDGGDTWTDESIAYDDTVSAVVYDTTNSLWLASIRDRIYNASGIGTWTQRTSPAAFTDINAMAYGSSKIVAVGNNGLVATSTNGGVAWTIRSFASLPAGTNMYGVVFMNSVFVATGANGEIQTSSDGITWTRRTSGTTEQLNSAVYHGSTWVVVGSNQKILTSTDLAAWTARTAGAGQAATSNYRAVRSDGTNLIICANNNDDYQTSTNATTWTKVDISLTGYTPTATETQYFYDAIWDSGNSRWIAVGKVGITAEGFDDRHWKNICAHNDNLTGAWTDQTKAGNSWRTYRSFSYDLVNDIWYAVADGTLTIVSTNNGGTLWNVHDLRAIAPSVFAGSDPIGAFWYNGVRFLVSETTNDKFYSAVSFDTADFAYGDFSGLDFDTSWTLVADLSVLGTAGTCHAYKTGGYINGQWLIPCKRGVLAKSSNGVNWSAITLPTSSQDIYQIAYGNSIYVLVGAGGRIFSSPDTITWTLRATSNATTSAFVHLYFDGGWFYAYTTSGQVHKSQDGVTWSLLRTLTSGIFEVATEYSFSTSASNKSKVGIMPSLTGLRKTADHFNFRLLSVATSFLSPQWRSVGVDIENVPEDAWVWQDGAIQLWESGDYIAV